MQFIDIKQNTEEWLQLRKKCIGASDSIIIMGVSPWTTPYQLWEVKVGLKEGQATNSAMQRGKDLEEQARQEFEKQSGYFVMPSVVKSETYPWMIASLDGIDPDKTLIVEIKCAGKYDHHSALEGKIPDKYIPQLQHQMAVTGIDRVIYFSYDGSKGASIMLKRDDEYIAKMMEKEIEFYRCMTEFDPPPLGDKDYVEIDDQHYHHIVKLYRENSKQIKKLKDEEEELKAKLLEAAKNRNVRIGDFKISKCFRKGAVDVDELATASGLDKEKFRKGSTQYWRMG